MSPVPGSPADAVPTASMIPFTWVRTDRGAKRPVRRAFGAVGSSVSSSGHRPATIMSWLLSGTVILVAWFVEVLDQRAALHEHDHTPGTRRLQVPLLHRVHERRLDPRLSRRGFRHHPHLPRRPVEERARGKPACRTGRRRDRPRNRRRSWWSPHRRARRRTRSARVADRARPCRPAPRAPSRRPCRRGRRQRPRPAG